MGDHFRSVKDYDLARNLPGKVKLSAPNLSKQSQNKKKKNKHQGGFRPWLKNWILNAALCCYP